MIECCKKCGKAVIPKDAWTLVFMGTFCAECARYVLAYWAVNVHSALKKVVDDEAVRETEKRRTV